MTGKLTVDTPDIATQVDTFARRHLRPSDLAEGWRQAWSTVAEFGLLRVVMPRSMGGLGLSSATFVESMIALGAACTDNGFSMGLNSHVWTIQQPMVFFGNASQKDRYLPDLMAGKSVGAYALTEKVSGSDAMALGTRAVAADDGFVLNGEKTYIGMGPDCDIALVFASTSPDRGSWGISVFIVEAGDDGFIRGPRQEKLGLSTLPMGCLSFQNCWIPQDRLLGPEGAGAKIFQETLDWERSFILASNVGAMSRQLAECVDFARERNVFGQPIAGFQSVSNRIADMRLRLETSKLMTERAADIYDKGDALSLHAAMTNLHVSEAFLASSIDGMRTFGGAGYLQENQIGTDLRDSLGGVIYSGTSDVQRIIIARMSAAGKGKP